MSNRRFRRKRYIVLVGFQLRYIIYILLFMYIGAAVAGYTVYWTTWVTLGEKLANVYPRSRLVYIFQDANLTLIFRMLLITPIFVVIGTLLSHRIAGPIYRLCRYIDFLRQGNYSEDIRLRKKDELKILAEKLTGLCHKLRQDKEEENTRLKAVIEELKKSNLPPETVENITIKLNKLLEYKPS